MASPEDTLPPGFVLDAPIPAPPPGFVFDAEVDTPEPVEGQPLTQSQIDVQIAQRLQEQADAPGFIERTGERFAGIAPERGEQAGIAFGAMQAEEQSPASTLLQLAGTGAGAALDVGGAAFGTLVDAGVSAFQSAAPQKAAEIEAGIENILGSENAQNAIATMRAIGGDIASQFNQLDPVTQRNVAAAANIAILAAPVRARPRTGTQAGIVGRAGERVSQAAATQEARRTDDFLVDLVQPKSTAKVRESQVGRVEGAGVLTGGRVAPDAFERKMADVVGTVEGVAPGNTLRQNSNAISSEITKEANSLRTRLANSRIKLPPGEVKRISDEIETAIADNPILVGDASKSAERIFKKAKQIMAKNPKSAAGLLKSRQELDRWITQQRPRIFDATSESALTTANRIVRQAINDSVARSAPNVAVRESLDKQSTLFRALDNINPKAGEEARSAIGRLRDRISKAVGLRESIVATGTLTGATILSPATVGAGIGLGGLTILGGKAIASPKLKRAIGSLLKQTDQAIKKTKDPATLRELRADRAAVLEIFKSLQETNGSPTAK